MFKANEKMMKLKSKNDFFELSKDLLNILSGGFVRENDCFFLKKLKCKKTNASEEDFIDKTGYESFINSIHIDDYENSLFVDRSLEFVKKLFYYWKCSEFKENIRAIISGDESGAVIKFHVIRDSESLVSDDLESYDSGILIVDSTNQSLSDLKIWETRNPG